MNLWKQNMRGNPCVATIKGQWIRIVLQARPLNLRLGSYETQTFLKSSVSIFFRTLILVIAFQLYLSLCFPTKCFQQSIYTYQCWSLCPELAMVDGSSTGSLNTSHFDSLPAQAPAGLRKKTYTKQEAWMIKAFRAFSN